MLGSVVQARLQPVRSALDRPQTKVSRSQCASSIPVRRAHNQKHICRTTGRPCRAAFGQHGAFAAFTDTEQQVTPASTTEDPSSVQNFLSWLTAQGVQDVQKGNSKLGVYNAEKGERGIMTLQNIQAGDIVLHLPVRIAITDHPGDKESNDLMYEGAPWSLRLACKLLREKAKGLESAWHPYLQVLPEHVPSPLTSFSWEETSDIEVPDMMTQLHEASWLLSDAYPRLSPEARGHATREELEWAVSVVHSRTFGTAAKEGGTAVHMLLPLVDFLNHGGDETECLPGDRFAPTANVRWHLVAPPSEDPSQGFQFNLVARQDIPEGQEVLLSYGDRNNDDFFLHYGFVPLRNPHDDAVLFQDLTDALDWHYDNFYDKAKSPGDEAEARELYKAAARAGQAQEGPPSPEDHMTAAMQEQAQKLRIYPGGLVDGRLMAAFQFLAAAEGQDSKKAVAEVAERCQQLLAAMSPLPDDLKALAADPWTEQDDRWYYVTTAQHYGVAIRSHPQTKEVVDTSTAAALEQNADPAALQKQTLDPSASQPQVADPLAAEAQALNKAAAQADLTDPVVSQAQAVNYVAEQQQQAGSSSQALNEAAAKADMTDPVVSQAQAKEYIAEQAKQAGSDSQALSKAKAQTDMPDPVVSQAQAKKYIAEQAKQEDSDLQALSEATAQTDIPDPVVSQEQAKQYIAEQQQKVGSDMQATGELDGITSAEAFRSKVLSPAKRLALMYRSQKKMLLWDVVLSQK